MPLRVIAVDALLVGLMACTSPGEGKPKAEVAEASPTANEPEHGADALAVDVEHSKIGFVGAKVTDTHPGVFEEFTGSLVLEGDSPKSIEFVVNTASVKSDSSRLDKHLRSDDFFDVEQFPDARFHSSSITAAAGDGNTHEIKGDLELHGVTKRITFPAAISIDANLAKGSAEFVINRKDFGIVYPGRSDDLIQDDVLLRIELSFPRT